MKPRLPRMRRPYAVLTAFAVAVIAAMIVLAASGKAPEPSKRPAVTPVPAGAVRGQAPGRPAPLQSSYTRLLDDLHARRIASATLLTRQGQAQVRLKGAGKGYTASYPVLDTGLADRIARSGAQVKVDNGAAGAGSGLLMPIVMVVVLGGMLAFMAAARRRSGGGGAQRPGGMALRKNAQLKEAPAVRFSDVAGCDEAVEEVKEIVDFLTHPERFERVGAQRPSGILLHGPPGTGKTLLAKALAGEAGMSFFQVAGSEFVQMYVGVGAARVRELFSQARAAEHGAVIFIDEIDALGRRRDGSGASGSNSEQEQTLNELLAQMDGFQTTSRVMVVAATNRIDVLDPALVRPGRLSRHIQVDVPSEEGRLAILRLYAHGRPFAADVDLAAVAAMTYGSSGADLKEMLNEAAIMAARADRGVITMADVQEGHLRSLAGPEKQSSILAEGEKEIVAVHEAGHVLCAELCDTHEKAQRATIRPRGRAAGMAVYGRTDRSLHSQQYIHEQLVCVLGGRAAEHVAFGTVSSGAANDLQKANAVARQAIEQLGLSPRAGQLISGDSGQRYQLAESTREVLDQEVERLVAQAYGEAIRLLEDHREQLDRLSGVLERSGDIDRLEIQAALGSQGRPATKVTGMGPRAEPVLSPPEPAPLPQAKASLRERISQRAAALRSRRDAQA